MDSDLHVTRLHQRVERQHRELVKQLKDGPVSWIVPRFLSGSVFGISVTIVLPGFLGGGLGVIDAASPAFWIKLLGPVVAAGVGTLHMYSRARRRSRRTLEDVIRQSDSELALLTAPGWVRRILRRGALLAVAIGVPVGALVAIGWPAADAPVGHRLLVFAGFLLATAAWALPSAFLVRWLSVRSYVTGRRFESQSG